MINLKNTLLITLGLTLVGEKSYALNAIDQSSSRIYAIHEEYNRDLKNIEQDYNQYFIMRREKPRPSGRG